MTWQQHKKAHKESIELSSGLPRKKERNITMRTRYHGCLCFSKEKPQHARASFVASLSLPL